MKNYMDTANRWAIALRTLMGYPPSVPLTNAIMFTTSGRREDGQDQQLAQLAVDAGQDIVHLLVDETGGLPTVSLIVRDGAAIRVISNAKVYVGDEAAPIQLLTDDRSWIIGQRYLLTEQKLPSIARQRRGRAHAEQRWSDLYEALGPVALVGSKFVKLGDRLADAIPMEQLNIAA